MAATGRPKKYRSKKALEAAIEAYFHSISRTIELTEKKDTGKTDKKGRTIYEIVKIVNDLGEPITVREYLIPPSQGALCLYLGIAPHTWIDYCDAKKNPEFLQSTTRTRARLESYLERELISRPKGVQGIIFNLQNNYNWKDKKEVEFGEKTSKALAVSGLSLADKMAMLEEIAREYTKAPEGCEGGEAGKEDEQAEEDGEGGED